MAIKLGNNPVDFKRPVHVVKFNGDKDSITFTFRYMDKRKFAAMIDERVAVERMAADAEVARLKAIQADAEEKGVEAILPPVSALDEYLKWSKQQAEYILQLASGWDLTDELSVENLQQLEDEFPGALDEIQNVFKKSITDVRVKNS